MIDVKIDTSRFDRAMKDYSKLTSKTIAEIVNTKGYYIAVNALNLTRHADPSKIRSELGQFITLKTVNKKGKEVNKKRFEAVLNRKTSEGKMVPLAGLIVNSKRKKRGLPLLYEQKLEDAMRKLYASRIRAINFVRAGWIPAINKLKSIVKNKGMVRQDTMVRSYGKQKGGVTAGQPTDRWESVCKIWNSVVGSNNKENNYVNGIKQKGLQEAFNKEAASMQAYIDRKLQQAADQTINRK